MANCSLLVFFIFVPLAGGGGGRKQKESVSLLISFYGPVFARCIFMTLRDSLPSGGRSLVCFAKRPEGFLLSKFPILPNCELWLKSLCKITAEWKWYLHQVLSKCKQNTVYGIMKEVLIKKWQERFVIMKERTTVVWRPARFLQLILLGSQQDALLWLADWVGILLPRLAGTWFGIWI